MSLAVRFRGGRAAVLVLTVFSNGPEPLHPHVSSQSDENTIADEFYLSDRR